MDLLLGLVVGLIVGLLINWVLAPLLERRDGSGVQQTLERLQERVENLEVALASGPIKSVVVRQKDDFTRIPALNELAICRLNEAGIYSFAQLADLKPEHLSRLARLEEDQASQAQTWIEAARSLAAGQNG